MRARFVIFVVMFGLMSGSVLAQKVRFAFTADIISGPGAGGSIKGTFFYDTGFFVSASDSFGLNDADFGNFTRRIHVFSSGGMGVDFTGALTDSFTNVSDSQVDLIDGSIQDQFAFVANGALSPKFQVGFTTTDLTLVNGLALPTNLFVPSGTDFSVYRDSGGNLSNLQITSFFPIDVDCDLGEDLQAAINSLKPAGGGTIVVTGTCERPPLMGSPQPFLVTSVRFDPVDYK